LVGTVTPGKTFALSGVFAAGKTGLIVPVYWKVIDDSQTANWAVIDASNATTWIVTGTGN
jgi:hypothetical protein